MVDESSIPKCMVSSNLFWRIFNQNYFYSAHQKEHSQNFITVKVKLAINILLVVRARPVNYSFQIKHAVAMKVYHNFIIKRINAMRWVPQVRV